MNLVRNAAGTFATRVMMALCHVGVAVLVARMLGPGGRGELAAALLVPMTLVGLLHLGFTNANGVFMGSMPDRREALVAQSIVVALGLGSLVAAAVGAVYLFGPPLPGALGRADLTSRLLALLFLPVGLLNTLMGCALWGANRIKTFNRLELGRVVGYAVLAVVMLVGFRLGVLGVVMATAVSALATAAATLLAVRRVCPVRLGNVSWPLVVRSLRFGVQNWAAAVANDLMLRVDQWFIAVMLGGTELGLYAVAVGMAEKAWMLPKSINAAVVPHLTQESTHPAASTRRVYRSMMLLFLPVFGLIAAGGTLLIGLLFGEAFTGSILPFLVLLPGVYLLGGGRVLYACLYTQEKPRYAIVTNWSMLAVNLVLNAVLIPLWGIGGAAAASLISYVGAGVLWIVFFCRETGSRPAQMMPRWSETRELLGDIFRRIFPRREVRGQGGLP